MNVLKKLHRGALRLGTCVCFILCPACFFPLTVHGEDAPKPAENASKSMENESKPVENAPAVPLAEKPSLQKIIHDFRVLRERMHDRGYAHAVAVLDQKIALSESLEAVLVEQFTLNHRRNMILLEMKKLEAAVAKNELPARQKLRDLEEELVNLSLDIAQSRADAGTCLEQMSALSLEDALVKDKAAAGKKDAGPGEKEPAPEEEGGAAAENQAK